MTDRPRRRPERPVMRAASATRVRLPKPSPRLATYLRAVRGGKRPAGAFRFADFGGGVRYPYTGDLTAAPRPKTYGVYREADDVFVGTATRVSGGMAQVLDSAGYPFSAPITDGEAGLHQYLNSVPAHGTWVCHVDPDNELYLGRVDSNPMPWAGTSYPDIAPYHDVGYTVDQGPFVRLDVPGNDEWYVPVRQLYPVAEALRNAAGTVAKGTGKVYIVEAMLLEHLATEMAKAVPCTCQPARTR